MKGICDNKVRVESAVALFLEAMSLFIITDFAFPKVVELDILNVISKLPQKTPTNGARMKEDNNAKVANISSFELPNLLRNFG